MELIIFSVILLVGGFLIYSIVWDDAIGAIMIIIGLLTLVLSTIGYIGSSQKAKYLNKKYGTNYTTQEIFWNGSLVKSELRLDDRVIDNNQKIRMEIK